MLRTYLISYLHGEEICRALYEKELQKTKSKEFRVEKVIKRKRETICQLERLR